MSDYGLWAMFSDHLNIVKVLECDEGTAQEFLLNHKEVVHIALLPEIEYCGNGEEISEEENHALSFWKPGEWLQWSEICKRAVGDSEKTDALLGEGFIIGIRGEALIYGDIPNDCPAFMKLTKTLTGWRWLYCDREGNLL